MSGKRRGRPSTGARVNVVTLYVARAWHNAGTPGWVNGGRLPLDRRRRLQSRRLPFAHDARMCLGLAPDVALLHDPPVAREAQERDPAQRLLAPIPQPRLRAPLDHRALAVDERLGEEGASTTLLPEHTGHVVRCRLG